MRKRWMFIIAELAAMIIIQLIKKFQYRGRDEQLPRGSKVRRIKGLPVIGLGWLRRKDAKEAKELAEDPADYHSTYQFVPKPLDRKPSE